MTAIFISHSSADNLVAGEIEQWLAAEGHRSVFLDFDPELGIPAGRNWERELYRQLRSCRAVIVVWSESSLASRWCFAEITLARSLGKALLPIRIDGCELDGLIGGEQAIDLRGDKNTGFTRLRRGLLTAGLDPANAYDWDASRAPYPGLLPLQQRDAAVFFGRDDAIGAGLDLMNRVHHLGSAGVAMVVGASGSGKSSLVRAGLVPRLHRDPERWLVLDPIRPRNDPVAELAAVWSRSFARVGESRGRVTISAQLNDALGDQNMPNPLVELAGELRRVAERPDAKVLLVVDQFEELLGPATNDASADVLAMLRLACQASGLPVVMLGTLRADFLGVFQKHPALLDLRCELLQVGPMAPQDVVKVIEEPARVAGLELESGLAAAIVADSATEDALPLLAFSLRELYDRFGSDGLLELSEYRALGGLHGALARVADDLFEAQRLSPEQQRQLRHAFLALVRLTEDDRLIPRVARWDELSPSVHPILEQFVTARLLVSDRADDARTVEVAHEALFRVWRRLADWLQQSGEAMRLRRDLQRAAAAWDGSGRAPEDLWRGTRLARTAETTLADEAPLGGVDRQFIEASLSAQAAARSARGEDTSPQAPNSDWRSDRWHAPGRDCDGVLRAGTQRVQPGRTTGPSQLRAVTRRPSQEPRRREPSARIGGRRRSLPNNHTCTSRSQCRAVRSAARVRRSSRTAGRWTTRRPRRFRAGGGVQPGRAAVGLGGERRDSATVGSA